MAIKTSWKGKMSFEWDINGHNLIIDASEKVGGENKGPTPKPFMLAALGGCTGMDVVSILGKMKVMKDVDDFRVDVDGELTDEHPKYYKTMHVKYFFKAKEGIELPKNKIEKAIKLSEENYCGVSALYKKAEVRITSELIIE